MLNIKFLKSLYIRFVRNTGQADTVFKLTAIEQQQFIVRFKEPKDDIERSYNQYCCQMKLCGFFMNLFLNVISLPLLLFFYLKSNSTLDSDDSDALFISEGALSKKYIPETLQNTFHNWKEIISFKEFFTDCDKSFFIKILQRYPFSWYFLLKNLVKIRIYSYLIKSFKPKAIVVSNEYSFTSSILTSYCNLNGVKHINIMHGEKLYFIRDSFFRYDNCYVWDRYYIEMFGQLRADLQQFVVAVPRALIFKKKSSAVKKYDYTFYLGGETGLQLKRVIDRMRIIKKNGYKVSIRPHPRYTDLKELKDLMGEDFLEYIENGECVTIEESILRTRHAIALYSTVLNQSYYNGTKIVIDNISSFDKYNRLYDLQYIMLNKEHECFSEVMKEMKH